MVWPDFGSFSDSDILVWHIPMQSGAMPVLDAEGFSPPEALVEALHAVSRDIRCLQYGGRFDSGDLIWELSIDSSYTVGLGWLRPGGSDFWVTREGVSMDASFAVAAVWAAGVAQGQLVIGREVVHWPSRGWNLLTAQLVDELPVWIDTSDGSVISNIGMLCEAEANW
ncbi:hypothetical protein [Nocardia ninae]|uniref:Uncharacterized protein n=1 Tax=Nocardia ninae NBRC 108245 TaxID=1210091 RepID=A0A511MGH8_9NOCA|nr:hypothetical protein [Nocardia ninae]GEM39780.1 hypothetical protein NN4_42990 [Nocardia ninae NBRC 108245]